MGKREPEGVTTSGCLGLRGCVWVCTPIKVKDMILKAAIEEAQRRDATQIEAFGGHLDEPTEV